jgi:hypothetical protein
MPDIDFPDSPVDGEEFDLFVYSAARQVWNFNAIQK